MQKIGDVIKKRELTRDTRNTHEFQAYGNRLASELHDNKHRALYIKLAKKEDRGLLEAAREHALASEKIPDKDRGKIFMWKLAELKKAKLNKKRT